MISFPIHKASVNTYFMAVVSNTPSQTPVPSSPKQEEKNNSKKLWLGLSVLAVAGAAAVGIYRAKTKNIKPIVNNAVSQTADLVQNTDAAAVFEAVKPVRDVKFFEDIKGKASEKIKNILKNLQGDSEWKELRKTRKELLKIIDDSNAGEQADIAIQKVRLLNNMIVCKAHPSEEPLFKGCAMMDIPDAKQLVGMKFNTLEDFRKAEKSMQKYDFEMDLYEKFFFTTEKLSLKNIFSEDYERYAYAKDEIANIKAPVPDII